MINTNNCLISVCESKQKNHFIILCAIDNLIKGGGGQAIQNLNIIYKLKRNIGFRMRIFLILFCIFCNILQTPVLNNNDKGLQIDIYRNDMNFEKFKKIASEYADKAKYPSLTIND